MQDPSQYPQQPGYAAPAPAAAPVSTGGGNRGRTIAIIAAVVVVVLAALGFLRYNGPVDTVKGFFNDALVSFNAQAAANRICSDSAEKVTDVAALQKQFDQIKGTTKFELSGVTYSTTSQNFISDATVHVDGAVKLTVTAVGQTSSIPFKGDAKLKSSGLGWCLESIGGSLKPTGA